MRGGTVQPMEELVSKPLIIMMRGEDACVVGRILSPSLLTLSLPVRQYEIAGRLLIN